MIEFPSNLIPLVGGFGISVRPVIERSEFESGPDRQRSNSCGQYIDYSITYSVCGCDGLDSFIEFFCRDLSNGAKSFRWLDPCSKEYVKARISDGTYSATPDNGNFDSFNISLNIEVWKPNA